MKHLKKWKELWFLLPAVILAVGAVAGFQKNIPVFPEIPKLETAENSAEAKENSPDRKKLEFTPPEKEVPAKKLKYEGEKSWKDGTYIGTGTGYGGSIKVQVVIKKGKIADVKILSHAQETPAYFSKAKVLADRIIKAQSPDVDVVSGATFSSRGIMEAVIQALIQAGDDSLTAEKTVSKKTVTTVAKRKKKETVKGKPADGVFSGSAVCERFGYTMHLKARFKKGKAVALYDLKVTGNSDAENVSYWNRAWKPVVRNILKKQSADVDAVSGATYSSHAVMDAYADAYAKAVAKNDPSAKREKKPKATPKPAATQKPLKNEKETDPVGEVKDGTYHVSAVCSPDSYQDFTEYTLRADVIFQEKKCTAITNFTSDAETNRSFYLKAASGTKKSIGVVEQILKNQSANGIYAVTGATCSSKTIRELYLKALTEATGVEAEEPDEVLPTEVPMPAETPMPTEMPMSTVTPAPAEDVPGISEETPAPAVPSEEVLSGIYKDGVYPVATVVYPDEDEDFYEYELRADAVALDGKFTGFENISVSDTTNLWYCNRALEGTENKTGILKQLLDKQNAIGIDMVSGATCSSDAWLGLFREFSRLAVRQED